MGTTASNPYSPPISKKCAPVVAREWALAPLFCRARKGARMNIVVFGLLGAALWAAFLGASVNGLMIGAAIGALAGWVSRLSKRVAMLEQQASTSEARAPATAAPRTPPAARVDAGATPTAAPSAARVDAGAARPAAPPAAPPPTTAAAASTAAAPDQAPSPPPVRPRAPSPGAASAARRARRDNIEPTLTDIVFDSVKRWFTTGNVPVKVGVVLSVFGVGFLIKEGIDRQWLVAAARGPAHARRAVRHRAARARLEVAA